LIELGVVEIVVLDSGKILQEIKLLEVIRELEIKNN